MCTAACVRQGVALCRGVPFCSHPLDYARVMSAATGDIGDVRQTRGKKGRLAASCVVNWAGEYATEYQYIYIFFFKNGGLDKSQDFGNKSTSYKCRQHLQVPEIYSSMWQNRQRNNRYHRLHLGISTCKVTRYMKTTTMQQKHLEGWEVFFHFCDDGDGVEACNLNKFNLSRYTGNDTYFPYNDNMNSHKCVLCVRCCRTDACLMYLQLSSAFARIILIWKCCNLFSPPFFSFLLCCCREVTPSQTPAEIISSNTGRCLFLLYIFSESMACIGMFDKYCVEHNEEAVLFGSG